jgi:hypothetical protein
MYMQISFCRRALHWEIHRFGQATPDAVTFVYLQNVAVVADYLIRCLEVSHWFFWEAQYSSLLDVLLADDEEGEAKSDVQIHWDKCVTFVLSLIQAFALQDPVSIQSYSSLSLAFHFITHDLFSQQASELPVAIGELPEARSPTPIPWPMERISQTFTRLDRLSSFLIQWALICGDARISLAALKPFLCLDLPVRSKTALAVIRNIYIERVSRSGLGSVNLCGRALG